MTGRKQARTKKAGGPWWTVHVAGSWGIVEAGSQEQAILDALCGCLGFDLPTLRTQLAVKPYLREGVTARIDDRRRAQAVRQGRRPDDRPEEGGERRAQEAPLHRERKVVRVTELDLSSPEALEASLKKAPPKKPTTIKADVIHDGAIPTSGPKVEPPKARATHPPTVAWLNERNGEISRRRICYSCPDVCNHGWVELVKR